MGTTFGNVACGRGFLRIRDERCWSDRGNQENLGCVIDPSSHDSFHFHYAKESVHTYNDGCIVDGEHSGLSGAFILGICTHFMKEKAAF